MIVRPVVFTRHETALPPAAIIGLHSVKSVGLQLHSHRFRYNCNSPPASRNQTVAQPSQPERANEQKARPCQR
ncbi:MAG: hypothetical protein QOF70_194 [Acetobacteraceae bacterium]|jgi:hypothetical protein|nr:hypothetical protein [Acetobacteraceae bacterium]